MVPHHRRQHLAESKAMNINLGVREVHYQSHLLCEMVAMSIRD
jgi:hypothetical protein